MEHENSQTLLFYYDRVNDVLDTMLTRDIVIYLTNSLP